jgi:hypothetical protein
MHSMGMLNALRTDAQVLIFDVLVNRHVTCPHLSGAPVTGWRAWASVDRAVIPGPECITDAAISLCLKVGVFDTVHTVGVERAKATADALHVALPCIDRAVLIAPVVVALALSIIIA